MRIKNTGHELIFKIRSGLRFNYNIKLPFMFRRILYESTAEIFIDLRKRKREETAQKSNLMA